MAGAQTAAGDAKSSMLPGLPHRPSFQEEQPPSSDADWKRATDPASKRSFYYSKEKGITQWRRPTAYETLELQKADWQVKQQITGPTQEQLKAYNKQADVYEDLLFSAQNVTGHDLISKFRNEMESVTGLPQVRGRLRVEDEMVSLAREEVAFSREAQKLSDPSPWRNEGFVKKMGVTRPAVPKPRRTPGVRSCAMPRGSNFRRALRSQREALDELKEHDAKYQKMLSTFETIQGLRLQRLMASYDNARKKSWFSDDGREHLSPSSPAFVHSPGTDLEAESVLTKTPLSMIKDSSPIPSPPQSPKSLPPACLPPPHAQLRVPHPPASSIYSQGLAELEQVRESVRRVRAKLAEECAKATDSV